MIEGGITVTVIEIRGDKVRIGIDAPTNVSVDREEVSESKRKAIEQHAADHLADQTWIDEARAEDG